MKYIPPAIRIRNASAGSISQLGRISGFFKKEGKDLVFYSRLADNYTISEHLVWIHNMIKHDAKILKRLRDAGADILLDVKVEKKEVLFQSNAMELPHKLGIPTEITLRNKVKAQQGAAANP